LRIYFAIEFCFLIVLSMSGCALNGRYQFVNGSSPDASVDGHVETAGTSIVADFRVVRVQMPLVFERGLIEYRDDATGVGRRKVDRTNRAFRLDVPLISFWDFRNSASFEYPGTMRRRESLELWGMVESNLGEGFPWVAGGGVVYYWYRRFALGVMTGYGSAPFSGGLEGIGAGYPTTISGRHEGMWMGVEMTLFAGEFALELWDYIVAKDRKERRLFDRY